MLIEKKKIFFLFIFYNLIYKLKDEMMVKAIIIIFSLANAYYSNEDKKEIYNKSLDMLNIKYNVQGNMNYKKKGTIIMSNHYNITDFLILNSIFDNTYTICKDDLFVEVEHMKIYKYIKKYFDNLVIKPNNLIKYKRGDKISGENVKKKIRYLISKGKNVILFPEGTSSRTGNSKKELKKGIFKLCEDYNIDITPVTLKYSKDIGIDINDTFTINTLCNFNCDVIIHDSPKGDLRSDVTKKIFYPLHLC